MRRTCLSRGRVVPRYAATIRRSSIITGSIILHLGVGLGLYAAALWDLERLEGRAPVFTGVSVTLPPPPPPAGGSPAPVRTIRVEPKLSVVRTLVQPTKPELSSLIASISEEPGHGTGTGKGPGVGDGDGPCLVEPCGAISDYHFDIPDVPAPPKFAQLDSERTEALRLSGETQIEPSVPRRIQMAKAKLTIKRGTFELCVSTEGAVSTVNAVRTTGFPEYDSAIMTAIRGWRYRPYTLDNVRQPFCGTVTFHYHLDIAHFVEMDGYRFPRDN